MASIPFEITGDVSQAKKAIGEVIAKLKTLKSEANNLRLNVTVKNVQSSLTDMVNRIKELKTILKNPLTIKINTGTASEKVKSLLSTLKQLKTAIQNTRTATIQIATGTATAKIQQLMTKTRELKNALKSGFTVKILLGQSSQNIEKLKQRIATLKTALKTGLTIKLNTQQALNQLNTLIQKAKELRQLLGTIRGVTFKVPNGVATKLNQVQQAASNLKQTVAGGINIQGRVSGFERLQQAIQQLFGLQRSATNARQAVADLAIQLGILGSATAGVIYGLKTISQIFSGFINMSRGVQTFTNSFKALGDSSEQVAEKLKLVDQISDTMGTSFDANVQSFRKFSAAARIAGTSQQDITRGFQNLQKALVTTHASASETSRAFLAIEQMFSKGKVSSEELRRQLGEVLPGAVALFAQSLGVTSGELDKLLRQGKVTAESIIPFLDRVGEQFEKGFKSAAQSIFAEIERLKNNFGTFGIVASKAFGENFKGGLRAINNAVRAGEGLNKTFETLGSIAGSIGNVFATAFGGLLGLLNKILTILGPVIDAFESLVSIATQIFNLFSVRTKDQWSDVFDNIRVKAIKLAESLTGLDLSKIGIDTSDAVLELDNLITQEKALETAFANGLISADTFAEGLNKIGGALKQITDFTGFQDSDFSQAMQENLKALDPLIDKLAGGGEEAQRFKQNLRDMMGIFDDTAIDNLTQRLEKQINTLQKATENSRAYARAMALIRDLTPKDSPIFQRLDQEAKSAAKSADFWAKALGRVKSQYNSLTGNVNLDNLFPGVDKQQVLDNIATSIQKVQSAIDTLSRQRIQLLDGPITEQTKQQLEQVETQLNNFQNKLQELQSVQDLFSGLTGIREFVQDIKQIENITLSPEQFKNFAAQLKQSLGITKESVNLTRQGFDTFSQTLQKMGADLNMPELTELGQDLQTLGQNAGSSGDELNKIADAAAKGGDSASTLSAIWDSVTSALSAAIDKIQEMVSAWDTVPREVRTKYVVETEGSPPEGATPAGSYAKGLIDTTPIARRMSGVDNQGGFPAILHPNESVVPHDKAYSFFQQMLQKGLIKDLPTSFNSQEPRNNVNDNVYKSENSNTVGHRSMPQPFINYITIQAQDVTSFKKSESQIYNDLEQAILRSKRKIAT